MSIARKRLGRSGLFVSQLGLGTMNFGSQLSEQDSHGVLDAAVDAGITFIDTAEMYSSPPAAETYGRSEEIIGSWLARRSRDSVAIASKIVGPPDGRFQSAAHVRSAQASLDAFHIGKAIDGSLKRLRTDYIDLIQFHWPDRIVPWEEQLKAIDEAVTRGKVRYFGCSNETAWGLMRAIACSERYGLPRPIAVQNVLNLVQQSEYETLEETCLQEQVGYIGYSPLAMGLLSGKYQGGKLPPGSRFTLFPRYRTQYLNEANVRSVQELEEIARARGVSLPQLAYWWSLSRPAVAVVLTSVSKVEQLDTALRAAELAAREPPLVLR